MLQKELLLKFLKIISLNDLSERTFEGGISVLCCYDPEGVVLKFVRGELEWILWSRRITTTTSSFGLCVLKLKSEPGIFFIPEIKT